MEDGLEDTLEGTARIDTNESCRFNRQRIPGIAVKREGGLVGEVAPVEHGQKTKRVGENPRYRLAVPWM